MYDVQTLQDQINREVNSHAAISPLLKVDASSKHKAVANDGSTGAEDEDGDGYVAVDDCDDGDGDINPSASEICSTSPEKSSIPASATGVPAFASASLARSRRVSSSLPMLA